MLKRMRWRSTPSDQRVVRVDRLLLRLPERWSGRLPRDCPDQPSPFGHRLWPYDRPRPSGVDRGGATADHRTDLGADWSGTRVHGGGKLTLWRPGTQASTWGHFSRVVDNATISTRQAHHTSVRLACRERPTAQIARRVDGGVNGLDASVPFLVRGCLFTHPAPRSGAAIVMRSDWGTCECLDGASRRGALCGAGPARGEWAAGG